MDAVQYDLSSQLIENIGVDEEVAFRVGANGLIVTRTHFKDGVRLQIETSFAKDSYDCLTFTTGDRLSKAIFDMAIALRCVKTDALSIN